MLKKAMHAVKLPAMVVANAVAVMAAAVAVLEASAVTVRKVEAKAAQKAGQRAEAMSAVNVVLTSEALSRAANSAMTSEVNNVVKAKSRVSHALRASRVNRAKAVARSVHAVNAVNAVSEATSRAHRQMPPNKTSHWPTRPPWLLPWVAGQQTRARKHRAANEATGAAVTTAAVKQDQSHAPTYKMRRVKSASHPVTHLLINPLA